MNSGVLYRVLQLRTDVFVVEQQCAYPELDGRDLESDALIVWGAIDDEVIATLRIMRDAEALRIGRVAVRPDHRGTGVAQKLFQYGLDLCAEQDSRLSQVLDAQEPLAPWYANFGFVNAGEVFIEDGISHRPMRREISL